MYCQCSSLNNLNVNQTRQKNQLLWVVLGLITSFFFAEWGVGLWSHSLSLQADAAHILSDAAALGLTLIASLLAKQPAHNQATFGHRRVEILAALVNGLALIAIAALIIWEAINRFQVPSPVLGLPMLIVAVIGLGVNTLNLTLLHKHSHNDLNLRGAVLHVVADVASSIGLILAALAIHFWNWVWADVAVSLLVACLIGISALPLIQESLKILMEYAPPSIAPTQVEAALKSYPGVCEVKKLHIWRITSTQVMLCAHLTVEELNVEQRDKLIKELEVHLHKNFGIHQSILQLTSHNSNNSIELHPLFNQSLIELLAIK